MESNFISCLIITAQRGFHKEVKPFIALCREIWYDKQLWAAIKDTQFGSMKRTHVMYAAKTGNIARLRWLLARGAQLNQKDLFDKNALAHACEFGQLDMILELIRSGITINTGGLFSPLYEACSKGHLSVVRMLLENGAIVSDFGILHTACMNGYVEVVRELLAYDAHLVTKDRDEYRETPLHIAINMGHLEVVRELVTRGAFLNDDNWHNETPICIASWSGNLEMVQLLISAGAHININPSPLFFACRQGHLNIVQELLTHGANVNLGYIDHWEDRTPLKIAKKYHLYAIVTLLLNNGATN